MFQNDHSNQYDPSAASSHQTNSAISRLSTAKVYAFFLAFIIFSSWFQLVAQLQTAISLILLAIIGFCVSQLTDRKRPEVSPKKRLLEGPEPDPNSIQLEPMNLLKSFEDDAADSPARKCPAEKPLVSPSASSASTGYNSDTRSANLTRLSPNSANMIELVSQPTALHLVMDQFSARSQPDTPLSACTPCDTPLKPARQERQWICAAELDCEPHYSSPFAGPNPAGSDCIPSASETGATCDRGRRLAG